MNENSELCILVENKDLNRDLLACFPYMPDQYESHLEDDEVADANRTWIIIDLADRTDTTTAQEQFLNTKSEFIEYTIR